MYSAIHRIIYSPKYRLRIISSAVLCTFLLYNFLPGAISAEDLESPTGDTEEQVTQTPEPVTESPPQEESAPLPDSGSEQTQEPGTEITNDADVTNDVESTALGGNNTIGPTPTPEVTPADTEANTPEDLQTESPETPGDPAEIPVNAETQNTTDIEEEQGVPDDCPESTPSATIATGDSMAVTDVVNDVNTTSVNSTYAAETVSSGSGSEPITVAPLDTPQPNGDEESPEATGSSSFSVGQDAVLDTTIVSEADSGNSTIESDGSGTITTGTAASIVNLTNLVNTTLINSILHIFTINIYGAQEGDIMLPEYDGAELFSCGGGEYVCSVSFMSVDNTADVVNVVDSEAVSGNNTIAGGDDSSITTGDAQSAVSVMNMINTVWKNADIRMLNITVFGMWIGDFLGWDGISEAEGGQSMRLASFSSAPSECADGNPDCFSDIAVTNSATVTNTVQSSASSGDNTIGEGGGSIDTGDALSYVNILNFVNTTLIDTIAAIGYINIFGSLEGDIGGASQFDTPDPMPSPTPGADSKQAQADTQEESEGSNARESGGILEVSLENNVGEYVYPGDTVTFFITIKNPGPGRVYDTVLDLGLFTGGEFAGMRTYKVGTIKPFGTVHVTTGLVLAAAAPAGEYSAVAYARGIVGPDDHEVKASGESGFSIRSRYRTLQNTDETGGNGEIGINQNDVLGAGSVDNGLSGEEKLSRFLMMLGGMVLGTQAVKRRKQISKVMLQLLFMLFIMLSIVTDKVQAIFIR